VTPIQVGASARVQFTIDQEFQSLIPNLSSDERSQLESNLLSEGCRDPLVVWLEEDTLLDGHNRSAICSTHNISYSVTYLSLPTRQHAINWIIGNQLGRRNLTPDQASYLRGKRYNMEKAQGARSDITSGQNDQKLVTTAERLAEEFGVGEKTVRRDGKFAEAVDTLSSVLGYEVRPAVLASELAKKDIVDAAAWYKENPARISTPGQPDIYDRSLHRVDPETFSFNTKAEIVKAAEKIKKEKRERKREEKAQKIQAVVEALPELERRYRLIHSPVKDLATHLEPESVDVIITDPPYPEEYLPVYAQLAELAQYALKPGGSIFVMVGQSYLPEIMNSLATHLIYNWTLAYLTPGGQSSQLWQRKVNTFWKPVLWYTKGTYAGDWLGDVSKSGPNDNDKEHHEWGQSESGMTDLVSRCSRPGDMILDPFCGAGTTGLIAMSIDRQFIGADISEECVRKSDRRLWEATCADIPF
jgi:hypothetical protein